MSSELTPAEIRYTPNAHVRLIEYLDRIEEYQDIINDDLETTSEELLRYLDQGEEPHDAIKEKLKITSNRARRLKVEVYRLQATTQALREHISATAKVVTPCDTIPHSSAHGNVTQTTGDAKGDSEVIDSSTGTKNKL